MTPEAGFSAPFRAVARWLRRALPASWRGVTPMDSLRGDPDRLPREARVRLVLSPDQILWREIDLPELPPERRNAWIAARLDEVSPWAHGAYHWAADQAKDGRLRVSLTAAEPIAALAARLGESGRTLVEATFGGLWLIEDAAGEARLTRRLIGVWALTLALGLGLALWSWTRLTEAEAARALADQRLGKLVAEASAGSATAKGARDLLALKTDAASLALALDRLAGSLPVDSHLETLRLTSDEFQITGRSAAPEAIIPALESAGGFGGVDFAGGSTRDAETGDYGFTLIGNLRGVP